MSKEEIILTCNEYLKAKTSSRFVFGGSYGLYMQGIDLNREFHDIDIKFLDIKNKDLRNLQLDFEVEIHKLRTYSSGVSDYHEINFCGEKFLVFTPQSTVDNKKDVLDFIENRAKIKTEGRLHSAEKIKSDLKCLKEKYGIE